MREYGQIQCAFWQSDDATKSSDAGKLLAAYLMTGPHSNGIGCYRCPDGYVMEDLGWTAERVAEGFEELFRKGFAYRFGGVVCLPKFLYWNKVSNGNVAKARMGEFMALPKGDAKALVARAMLEYCAFLGDDDRKVLKTVSETLSKGYAKQNPTLPREHPDQEPTPPDPSSLRSDSSQPSADDPPADDSGKPELKLTGQAPTDLAAKKAERIRQVAADAVEAFNASLAVPKGVMSSIRPRVGSDTRIKQVRRCVKVAREICQELYGSTTITRRFWEAYFGQCGHDDFLSGRQSGGKGHENWTSSFEYLTREEVMLKVFDKVASGVAA